MKGERPERFPDGGDAPWELARQSSAAPEPPSFRFDDADALPLPVPLPKSRPPEPGHQTSAALGFAAKPEPPVVRAAASPAFPGLASHNVPAVARGAFTTEAPAPKRAPALSPSGWLSFVAWVVFWAGAALADASRPGFRVVTGLDSMFGVVRGTGGDVRLAEIAGVLFVFASAFGLLGVIAALVAEKRKVPWSAIIVLLVSAIALVFYRP